MENQQPSLELRQCKKCGESKLLAEFQPYQANGKTYRRHECHDCRKSYQAAWARGEIQPVPEGDTRTCRVCGQTKPMDEFAIVYCQKSRGKQYRQHTCKPCAQVEHAARMRKAREDNPDTYKGHQRQHRIRHLDRVRRQRRESGGRLKNQAFAAYGGYKCVCCGETQPSMLTLDHINNDGAAHRRTLNGGRARTTASVDMYRRLKDEGFPPIMQVLCYNCNISKHRNRGTCAHKLKSTLKEGSTTRAKARTPQAIGGGSARRLSEDW
jgi:hypothetical protein